ncbi:MAG: hypothetical protein C5B50_15310, partial [Verrucomicrobia bacterium]
SATVTRPFAYLSDQAVDGPFGSWSSDFPENWYARLYGPTNYAYSGYRTFSPNLGDSFLEELRPVRENSFYENFAFSGDINLNSGASFDPSLNIYTLLSPTNAYSGPGTESPLPISLTQANSQWLLDQDLDLFGDPALAADIGLYLDANTNLVLASDAHNLYGLRINSVIVPALDFTPHILSRGSAASDFWGSGNTFIQTEQPGLRTVDYYFASQMPFLYYGWNGSNAFTAPSPPLPGSPTFSTTNVSPLLIASVGQRFAVSGWAKMAITNGYADRFGYVEQYFDKALTIEGGGNVTTNQTGILSPYGEFFPTIPGQVALVTMPDIDTGQRGTGIVNVIKLQLDVNHDGTMELSFGGPDNTSQTRPFMFWINKDNDGTQVGQDTPVAGSNVEDFRYGKIRSWRNLEDFARLWVCGLPKLPTTNGYAITLAISAASGNPTINLYPVFGTNSGTGYLTDTNVAAAQFHQNFLNGQVAFDYSQKLCIISPMNKWVLPVNSDGGPQYTNFLFEGAGIGTGQLTLTISQVTAQGSNVVGQTSAWLDLHNVEDFYERGRGTNVTAGLPPSDLVSQYDVLATTKGLPDESSKHVIVHVHGINISEFQWKVERDTIFKRLYWSGYHGRFASFRWPCAYLPFENTLNPFNYNLGEFYAYKSATALKNYLTYLRNRPDLAGYSLDILAHSQGNVITSEAIHQGATFDNYILSQASTPAHCYDMSAPFLQKLLVADTNTPTPFYTTNGGYHGYFANIGGGRLIDFFNTNDFALVSGTYFGHQANWEADQETQKPEDFSFRFAQNYSYYPTSHRSIAADFVGFGFRDVTDPHEIMSMVARSRSRAAGAQPGLGGPISGSVDLRASFGFDISRDEHSAQITRPIQTVWKYYNRVLVELGLQPSLQP